MKRSSQVLAALIGLTTLLIAVQSASALSAYPKKAKKFCSNLVRAMDECNPAVSVVTTTGDPPLGCHQANTVTDDGATTLGATLKTGKLCVQRFPGGSGGTGRIRLIANGMKIGQRAQVCLKIRTTHVAKTTYTSSITFADQTICCGPNNNGVCVNGINHFFTANPKGSIAGVMELKQCLTDNGLMTGLAKGNIEIVGANLTNCDTGKVFAVPGILD